MAQKILSPFDLIEQGAPGTPSSGFGRFYVGTDGKPYFVNDAGVTTDLSLGGESGGGPGGYYTATVGNGSATEIDVVHNLGTYDVAVTVAENSGTYRNIELPVARTDTNTVRLYFTTAPTTNQYRVIVQGAVEALTVPTAAMGFVNHGSTASTARPSGYASVTWMGSVEPTNSINGDIWINTTP